MARWPGAIWQPGAPCSGTLRPIAVTLHHQAGSGNPLPVYQSRRVSAHFWIPKNGQPVQHVDTGVQAWHGVAHNAYSIGVETEGCGAAPHAEPLTENQLNQFAALMKWANATHGVPLVLSESVTTPGLNYHRCQGGPATGCPCDVRVNARAEILRRAGSAAPAPAPPAPAPTPPPSGGAPAFPGRILKVTSPMMSGGDVRTWQQQMANRGWRLGVDGVYGNESKNVCTSFQREKGLGVDGMVGPQTWAASWNAPVT
jgi:N-acetylmuramoyl-L-alanine amidase/Putative peptidoglycan binding domain